MEEETKKVKAEIVTPKKDRKLLKKIKMIVFRAKLGIAILLDGIDLLIAWIPIVNIIWDLVTFIILLILLKNKKLAFFSLIEVPLIGLPPFSIIDMFLPIATLVTLMDGAEKRVVHHTGKFVRIE